MEKGSPAIEELAIRLARLRRRVAGQEPRVGLIPRTGSQAVKPTSKQDQVFTLLRRENGACIYEIVTATDRQPYSARGSLSGAVKKRPASM